MTKRQKAPSYEGAFSLYARIFYCISQTNAMIPLPAAGFLTFGGFLFPLSKIRENLTEKTTHTPTKPRGTYPYNRKHSDHLPVTDH